MIDQSKSDPGHDMYDHSPSQIGYILRSLRDAVQADSLIQWSAAKKCTISSWMTNRLFKLNILTIHWELQFSFTSNWMICCKKCSITCWESNTFTKWLLNRYRQHILTNFITTRRSTNPMICGKKKRVLSWVGVSMYQQHFLKTSDFCTVVDNKNIICWDLGPNRMDWRDFYKNMLKMVNAPSLKDSESQVLRAQKKGSNLWN